ncbi:MAG TPA: hypothetical protein VHX66_17485 [Solirubrobacteraceae bacterium]|jgi:hypothetical protein|nr:hypothetical protein [Solirubrobacteraceae bacterium]
MKRLAATIALVSALALATVALAGSPLSGTYNTTIGKGPLGGKVAGAWSLAFSSPNYTVSYKGAKVAVGTYTTGGGKVTFSDKSGKLACPGKGVYSYKLNGRSLTFKAVSDKNAACAGRRAVLAGTFTKKFTSSGGGGY